MLFQWTAEHAGLGFYAKYTVVQCVRKVAVHLGYGM
jgi:hypothetical protein